MTTRLFRSIKGGFLATGLAASLFVGLGVAGHAEARVPEGDRMTGSATVCGYLQDLYDQGRREFYNATTMEATRAAAKKLDEAERLWRNAGCEEDYGTIYMKRPLTLKNPVQVTGNLTEAQ